MRGSSVTWLSVIGLVTVLALTRGSSAPSFVPPGASPSLPVMLDASAGGSTIQVHVGQAVDLDLGAGYSAPRSSDSGVLVEVGSPQICTESEGCWRYHFQALRPGEVDLVYTQRAVCKSGEMCPMFIFLWTVHVQVRA
jgi:hypothetical protein